MTSHFPRFDLWKAIQRRKSILAALDGPDGEFSGAAFIAAQERELLKRLLRQLSDNQTDTPPRRN